MYQDNTNSAAFSGNTLSRYFMDIRRYPILSFEEEQELAYRYRETKDQEAVSTLVNAHLRLVAKIAMGYRGYGLPIADIISEGNVGLMKAVHNFDPDKGFRLSTYAMWWIKASIQEYILHSWSLVKIGTTAAQKKLFFNLRRLKSRLRALEEGDLTPSHVRKIAKELDVPERDVVSMNRRMLGRDHSLNAPVANETTDEWIDWLEDKEANPEVQLGRAEEAVEQDALLSEALKALDERECDIIRERHLTDKATTLDVLSQKHGVSRERIRQIETVALKKIEKQVERLVRERKIVF